MAHFQFTQNIAAITNVNGTSDILNNYILYTFIKNGSITFVSPTSVSFLIVGGGGAGVAPSYMTDWGGGGGGGGGAVGVGEFIFPAGTYNIIVGAGGKDFVYSLTESISNGGDSSIIGQGIKEIAKGGGGGGRGKYSTYSFNGKGDGGCGGGASNFGGGPAAGEVTQTVGTFTYPNSSGSTTISGTITYYGNPGAGSGSVVLDHYVSGRIGAVGGGGGGAGSNNATSVTLPASGGNGGDGYVWPITNLAYAGGGGGGTGVIENEDGIARVGGMGGKGGGGKGGRSNAKDQQGCDAQGQCKGEDGSYYGGGGGGGHTRSVGGHGHSGIVIIALQQL